MAKNKRLSEKRANNPAIWWDLPNNLAEFIKSTLQSSQEQP